MEYTQVVLMRLLWVLVMMLAVENGCNGCLEKERFALLQLKDSINFPNGTTLPSWEEDDYLDCCQWERVTCNSTTRRVIKLSLNYTRYFGRLDGDWLLNASILLPFETLQSLDLSGNQLRGFVGNKGLGILSNLEDLDLGFNELDNNIIPYLKKLSNLKILNLAANALNGSIYMKEFDGLNNLMELDLWGNRIASIIGLQILSNLQDLDLSGNRLDNSIIPSLNKLSNLKILNLVGNQLNGSISMKEFDDLNNLKELHLRGNRFASIIGLGILSNLENLDLGYNELDNSIIPSLKRLSNLKRLNLAGNQLNGSISMKGSQEESGILNRLEVLDLSRNDFNDSIWSFFGELSSLKTLYLSDNNGLHGAIHELTNLSSIENLFMDNVTLGDDFLPNIRVMTSIQILSLRDCELNHILPIKGLCELKTLRQIDIAGTSFGGTLPWCLVNLTALQLLDITSNHFTGNIAWSPLINLTSLEYLAVSDNDFESPISFMLFYNHSKLKFIESLNNKLLEEDVIFTTSPRFQLIGLRLSNSEHDRITRSFPQFLYHQHDLILVELSTFTEKFPYWLLKNNTRMETLLLSYNSFGGPLVLPSHHVRNLLELDISNNHLEGFIPYKIASSFPSLKVLNMSTNNFEGNIPSSLGNMTALTTLDLSNNKLSGEIPRVIGNLSLLVLAMPSNHLEGHIPIEFCELKRLWVLDLSENSLTGVIPSCFNPSDIISIRLSKNRLHGPFPMVFQNNSMLMEIDLSYNQFGGNVPTWIGSLSQLNILLLQHNDFEGNIPMQLCHLSKLTLINLSFNYLFGSIPPCIGKIDFNGFLGLYLGVTHSPILPFSFYDQGLSLHKNIERVPAAVQEVKFETKGMTLPYKGKVLYLFSGINLSHNRLSGPIPPEIGNLSHIRALNLSHNHLTGTIPATFSKLESIESLDLSYNHLNGKIPLQLTELNFLVVFNVSNNNLSGRTPQRVDQFATFESNSYVGNPLLCGEPLPRKCNTTDSPPSMPRAATKDTEEDSGFMDMDAFYMSFAGSYVTVVLAIVVILFINPYWRRAWFHLVEVSITSCYYFVVDNLVYPVRGFIWK